MSHRRNNSLAVAALLCQVGLLAAAALLAGCPKTGTDACSAPGAASCPCTSAGACDPGLVCTSGTCLSTSSPAAPSDPAPSGQATSSSDPTLSSSAFVFWKRFRRVDPPAQPGRRSYPEYACHLYAYDLATRTERLISNLDDDGVNPNGGCGNPMAVSPDRRWIAFPSFTFRRTSDDSPPNIRTNILWGLRADGKELKRLTPKLPEDYELGSVCAANGGCPADKHCGVGGRCRKLGFRVGYGDPVWSRDGQTIYLGEGQNSECNLNNAGTARAIYLCNYVNVLPLTNGVFGQWASPYYRCLYAVPLALHPQKDTLLVYRAECFNSAPGLFEFSTAPQASPRDLRSLPDVPGTPTGLDAAWLPDGSGLLLVTGETKKTKINPEGPERPNRQGLYLWTETGGYERLYEPDNDENDIVSMDVSGSGQVVVAVAQTVGGREASQLFLFDLKTRKLTEQLTRTGDNSSPDW
jgi:hypothetical protein